MGQQQDAGRLKSNALSLLRKFCLQRHAGDVGRAWIARAKGRYMLGAIVSGLTIASKAGSLKLALCSKGSVRRISTVRLQGTF